MEAYDDFACAIDEEEQEAKSGELNEKETSNYCNGQPKSPTSKSLPLNKLNLLSCTITSFYHGQIPEKEATFRLRNSPVGSFLLRSVLGSIKPPSKKCLSYYVSFSYLGTYLHLKVMHKCLDDYIRPGGSLQEAMTKMDPDGRFFWRPVHPNKCYKQARVQTWKCDRCQFKTTNVESFLRHKDEEKMLMRLTPLPNVKFIKCEKCDFKTVLKAEFASHIKKAHAQNTQIMKHNPKIRLVNKMKAKREKKTGTENGVRE